MTLESNKSHNYYIRRRNPEFVHKLRNLYRLAVDAMKIGTLTTYNGYFGLTQNYIDESFYPRKFLEWAQSKGYEIPEELKLLLAQPVSDFRRESEAQPTTYEFEKSKPLGRREQQLFLITEVIVRLGYNPLAIPNGGKAKIKKICEENNSLFKETSFDHAWKEARRQGKVQMANHEEPTFRGF